MKENEAIEIIKQVPLYRYECELEKGRQSDLYKALYAGIKALETTAELKKRNLTLEHLENYMQFEDECIKKNFTFKSLLDAREKQTPTKPIHIGYEIKREGRNIHKMWCGKCGKFSQRVCYGDKYCRRCGTLIDWSE